LKSLRHNQIHIFDFCETLVNKQTADDFVNFVLEHKETPNFYLRRSFLWLIDILSRFKFFIILNKIFGENSFEKVLRLFSLKSLDKEYLIGLGLKYSNYLKNHLNNNVWNLFEKMEINKRIVCSGGYDIYLKCFFSGNEIDRLICSEFEFKNNRFTGFWEGKDCMRDEKVKRLEKLGLKKEQIVITVYTDSSSDLPLLKYADKGIVVGKSQKPSWANRFEFLTWD
jgi:hypothetical protein